MTRKKWVDLVKSCARANLARHRAELVSSMGRCKLRAMDREEERRRNWKDSWYRRHPFLCLFFPPPSPSEDPIAKEWEEYDLMEVYERKLTISDYRQALRMGRLEIYGIFGNKPPLEGDERSN